MSDDLIVAIPTLGMSPLLPNLVEAALADPCVDAVIVLDGSTDSAGWHQVAARCFDADGRRLSEREDRAGVMNMCKPGESLYAVWNAAADVAGSLGQPLALLNDDIVLAPRTLSTLHNALLAAPDFGLISVDWESTASRVEPTVELVDAPGTFSQGGIAGWGFVVRPGSWCPVDERLRIWYGDDHLVEQMLARHRAGERGFRVGRLRGCSVAHETSTTVNGVPWRDEAIASDREVWAELHRS